MYIYVCTYVFIYTIYVYTHFNTRLYRSWLHFTTATNGKKETWFGFHYNFMFYAQTFCHFGMQQSVARWQLVSIARRPQLYIKCIYMWYSYVLHTCVHVFGLFSVHFSLLWVKYEAAKKSHTPRAKSRLTWVKVPQPH